MSKFGDKGNYLYDHPEDYVREATYAEPGSRPAFRTSYEEVKVPGKRGTFRNPARRKSVVGERHTTYVSDTIPIFERHADGTHVVVSADATRPLGHPLAEIFTTATSGRTIENAHIEGVFERSKELLAAERRDAWLNDHGKVLAKDTENIVSSMERLFLHKNKEGSLQRLVSEAAISAKKSTAMLKTKTIPTAAVATTTSSLAGTFRELSIALLRSGELREIFNESLDLFRDLLKKRGKTFTTLAPGLTTYEPQKRVVRTEYEVKNVDQQPFVERTIITESIQPLGGAPTTYTQIPITRADSSLTDRSIGLLRRFGSKPEFKRAVLDIMKIIDSVGANIGTIKGPEQLPIDTTHSAAAFKHASTVFDSFVGEHESKQFRSEFYSLYRDIKSNPEMSSLFSQLRAFIISSVENPESLDDPNKRRELEGLVSTSQRLVQKPEWKTKFRSLLSLARQMLTNLRRDSDLTDLTRNMQVLLQDLVLNNQGQPDLWVLNDSITQMKLILVPLFRGHFDNIPIDRIEMVSPKIDLVLEDIMLSASALSPHHMQFQVKNKMDVDLHDVALQYTTHTLTLSIDRFNPVFRNVRFYFRTKQGFRYEDYGYADVGMKEAGMSIYISWKLKSAAGLPPAVYLSKVAVTIHNLYIRIDKAKHSFIDKLVTSLFIGTIKKRMAASIARYLQLRITKIDDQINYFFAHRPMDKVIGRADMALKSASAKMSTRAKAAERDKRKKEYKESKGLTQPTLMSTIKETVTKGLKSAVGITAAKTGQAPSFAAPAPATAEYTSVSSVPSYVTSGTSYAQPVTGATTYVSSTPYVSSTTVTTGAPAVTTSVPSSVGTGLATPQTATYVSGFPTSTYEQIPRSYATYTAIPKTASGSFIPSTTIFREERPGTQPAEFRSVRFAESQKQSV